MTDEQIDFILVFVLILIMVFCVATNQVGWGEP